MKRPRANARRGLLRRWDRLDHGADRGWMRTVQCRFPTSEFGSSRPRELTIRSEDGRLTVYIARRPDGGWIVRRRPMQREFPTFEAMLSALRCWGF